MNPLYMKTNGDSTTHFPVPLEREGFMCKVVEIGGKLNPEIIKKKTPLYLCSDFCEDCYVGSRHLPVLRKLRRNSNGFFLNNLTQAIWVKVMRPTIDSIRLYICNEHGEVVSLGDQELHCTLAFVPSEEKWL